MTELKLKEGMVSVPGGNVWYCVVGENGGIPLLLLHGGPGASSGYLETLLALADERPIVLYDQLGGGKSDRPDDDELWTMERYAEEIYHVRQALHLDRVHIFGTSGGCLLATDTYLAYPTGIISLILASPLLNIPLYTDTVLPELIAEMPEEHQITFANHLAHDEGMTPEYQAVINEYNNRYASRHPLPDSFINAFSDFNWRIREVMWGPDVLIPTGPFAHYDRTEQLATVKIPVLLTCGRYDSTTPMYLEWHKQQFPNAETAVFEHSGHLHFLEESEEYNRVLRDFLKKVEE